MESVKMTLDCCSWEDSMHMPERKKQRRDSCSEYKKTVSVLKQCDIKRGTKHVYRPLDFIMANIKKQKSRFGTVVLSRDMTEEEVRRKMCDAFPILKNNRFSFAAADITGALDYHEESNWTGAEVKRHVPGGSALYIVMEDKEVVESQFDIEDYEVENVASMEKPTEICENAPAIKKFPKFQNCAESIVKHDIAKTHLGCFNSTAFKQAGTLSSSNLFVGGNSTSNSCVVFSSSVREKSIPSSNEKALMTIERISPDQNKDAKNSKMSFPFQTLENPSVISDPQLLRSATWYGKQCEEKFGKQDQVMKDKQIYTVACLPPWIAESRGVHSTQKDTDTSVLQKADGLPCDFIKQAHPFSTTMRFSNTSLPTAASPVSVNKVSIKRENEIPIYFCKEPLEKVDPVKTGLSSIVAVSPDDKRPCITHVSPITFQLQSGSIKDTQGRTTSNLTDITLPSIPLEKHLPRNSLSATRTIKPGIALNTTKTAAVKPSCAGLTLPNTQLHTQTPKVSSTEEIKTSSLLEDNNWSSLLTSSNKCIERALEKLFEEVAESSEKRLNGSYGIVDEIIPREGPCRGGQEFVIILKEVLPSCFKEDEVIVRFGQDVGTVAVLWRGDKALKGKTKPAKESVSVKVTVETAGGAVLGHAHFTYVDPMLEALKHIICSQELAPLFLAILEQNIQGCEGNSSADQDPERQSGSIHAPGQSLLELMVYTAAQSGSYEFVHTVFSSAIGEMAVSTYCCRAIRPEYVASRMGHQQLAEYLAQQFKRVSLLITRSDTASESVDISLASTSNQDRSSCEISNSQPTFLMLLSDIATRLNESDEEKSRSVSQASHINRTECLKNTLHPKNINDGASHRENLVCVSGDSQPKESFQSCNPNSVKEKVNQILVSKKVRLGDPVVHSSKESKSFPTAPRQILCQTEFVQKVVMLKEKLPSLSSLVLPRHVHVDQVTCKNVLLNVHMSEKEVKAKVACSFHLAEQDRIVLAIADSSDILSIQKEEKLSGMDICRMTGAGSSPLYVIQESVTAAELENARCSNVGDGDVEFKKRVMILKRDMRYLPSAMELAKRRNFQELYQGVLFSKKMEECEVMVQLQNAFEILDSASFRLAVADRNGVLDFRSGKEWNGDNISRWAKNACVLYLVPEVTLKGDPLDSFDETNEFCEARPDLVEPNFTYEETATLNTSSFFETVPEKCDKRSKVYNLKLESKEATEEEMILEEKCTDVERKVERRSSEEEKLVDDQLCATDETEVAPYFNECQDRKVNHSLNSTFPDSQSSSDFG